MDRDLFEREYISCAAACRDASDELEAYTYKARDERGDWAYTCVDARNVRVLMLVRNAAGKFVWVVASRMQ